MGLFHSNDYSIIVQRKIEIFLEKYSDVEKNFRDVKDENREEICTYACMSSTRRAHVPAYKAFPLSEEAHVPLGLRSRPLTTSSPACNRPREL